MWQVGTEFEQQWVNGKIQGWENEVQENGHVSAEHTVIDLDYYSTVEELMLFGPEKLKEVSGLSVFSTTFSLHKCIFFSFKTFSCRDLIL